MQRVLIAVIRFYQRYISVFLSPSCRYFPTCSEYMSEAIQKHGALKGVFLGCGRICRCHPLGSSGLDPVPEVDK